jgi:hypothetical protein
LKKKRGRKPKNQKATNENLEEDYNFNSEQDEQDSSEIIDDKNSKGVRITRKNTVRCDTQGSMVHSFALTTVSLEQSMRWLVKINKVGRWLGLGVCCKNVVIGNNFRFNISYNGCFILSTNCYIWNPNVEGENNLKLREMPNIENGDIIQFYYDCKKLRLEIRFKEYTTILTNVFSENGPLVPCAIFLGYNDETSFFKFENI